MKVGDRVRRNLGALVHTQYVVRGVKWAQICIKVHGYLWKHLPFSGHCGLGIMGGVGVIIQGVTLEKSSGITYGVMRIVPKATPRHQ